MFKKMLTMIMQSLLAKNSTEQNTSQIICFSNMSNMSSARYLLSSPTLQPPAELSTLSPSLSHLFLKVHLPSCRHSPSLLCSECTTVTFLKTTKFFTLKQNS